MALSRSLKARTALAVCLGIPVTLLYGALISVVLVVVAASESPFLRQSLYVMWCLAGFGGLAGFWTWVFAARPIALPKRLAITSLVCGGEIAAYVVVVGYDGNLPQRALVVTSMVVGIVICLWFWVPNFPLNPDAPTMRRAD
jgi:hypothetical protein